MSVSAEPDLAAKPESKVRAQSSGGLQPALAVAALGVVFGDIGTSPLYTLKECMTTAGGARAGVEDLFGILSLMFWSLVMVVTVARSDGCTVPQCPIQMARPLRAAIYAAR